MVSATSMSHVLLCAGSLDEWAATSVDDWRARLDLVAKAASAGGAEWATIIPARAHSSSELGVGVSGTNEQVSQAIGQRLVSSCGGVWYAKRVVVLCAGGVTVIVDPQPDGQQRIADAATQIATVSAINEDQLAAAICAPAPNEPDLVIVLGPATVMPTSLVWELAYAEIVFFDAPWQALDAEHVEMAIDDFTRRDRRFGGVDS